MCFENMRKKLQQKVLYTVYHFPSLSPRLIVHCLYKEQQAKIITRELFTNSPGEINVQNEQRR